MTTEGTKQHYLPACIIGRFSFEQEKRLRERRVFVLGRGKNKIFNSKTRKSLYAAWHVRFARIWWDHRRMAV